MKARQALQNAKEILDENRIVIVVILAAIVTPLAVAFLSKFVGDSKYTNSISAYYYSIARDLFVMALTAGGLLLISYPGREKRLSLPWVQRLEYWFSTVAGGMAFFIILFPMSRQAALDELKMPDPYQPTNTFIEMLYGWHDIVHIISAITFFALVCGLCFLFSREKVDERRTTLIGYYVAQFVEGVCTGWSPRHPGFPYKVWGMTIVLGLAWAAFNLITGPQIYWPEVMMLVGFSGMWLSKLVVKLELHR